MPDVRRPARPGPTPSILVCVTDVIAGRFALCDPIARGGSGTVWRAYDRKAGQFCAAKVLRRRDAGDLLRFVREQSVRLTHPYIVTPYSWAAEDAHVVIASDLVDGGSLATLIGDYGPIAENTVAQILSQLLEALDYVHTAGFVHRDVKPANLLLSATGTGPIHVRLADFGIAMSSEDARLTQTGTVVGTPGYLAPEVLRGDVAPEPRHDLYAAGRVAAALAAGTEPHGLLTPVDLSGLYPGPLRDLVVALTNTFAADRPPSARAALDALRSVPSDPLPITAGGDPIEVLHQLPPLSEEALREAGAAPTQQLRVSGAPSRVGRRSGQGHRVLLTVAGVAVAAAIGVPVGFAVLGGGESPGPGTPTGAQQTESAAPPTTPSRPSGAPEATTPTPTPNTRASGSVAGQDVQVGASCTFLDQGNEKPATDGGTATCVLHKDGSYVWERA